jgi:hypothetical protein
MSFKSHIWKKKKNRVSSGFDRVARVIGQPAGSSGFDQAFALAGLLVNLDQSSHRAGPSLIILIESIDLFYCFDLPFREFQKQNNWKFGFGKEQNSENWDLWIFFIFIFSMILFLSQEYVNVNWIFFIDFFYWKPQKNKIDLL